MTGLRARRLLLVLMVGIAGFVPVLPAEAAPRKPTSTQQKLAICDLKYINCNHGCDQLIDIGTAVADCQKRCDRRYSGCQRRAQALEVPPGGGGSLSEHSGGPEIAPLSPAAPEVVILY